MSIRIRPAEIGDINSLMDIERICFPSDEAATNEEIYKRYKTFPENFFVAIYNRKVIGFINGCTHMSNILLDDFYHNVSLHNSRGDYMMVFGLSVLPEYQHQGIARMLLETYIEVARLRNKKGVVLTCKDHLIHYYEKFGFINNGVSQSTHGGMRWNDMILFFEKEEIFNETGL